MAFGIGVLAFGCGSDSDPDAATETASGPSMTGSTASDNPASADGATSPGTTSPGATSSMPTEDSSTSAPDPSSSTGEEGRDYGPERDEFFGDSRCDEADVLLCDGFEGTEIDPALWEIVANGGTVQIVADEAARGGGSVHIQVTNGRGFLRNTTVFPVAGDRYWGRMFIRVDRFSTVDWAHWTMAEAAGDGDGSLIRVGGQYNTNQGQNRWGVGSDGGPTGDWTTHDQDPDGSPIEPPEDEWICLEWLHDGSTDEALLFVDAIEHPSLATTSTMHGGNYVPYDLPSFTSVWFGWWQYQSDPAPFDVWIDEIAIDVERMGCKL